MDIGGWLRSLGLEQYEVAFHANAVDAGVLRDLTDQDLKKLEVPLGHRRKLLRAIAALDDALALASAPRPAPLPILPGAILAATAAGAARERQQGKDHSVSPSLQPSPMSSRLRPAEMIGDRFLPSLEGPTLLLTAFDDRHDDDIQTAETGDAYGAHDYRDDLPSPRPAGSSRHNDRCDSFGGIGGCGRICLSRRVRAPTSSGLARFPSRRADDLYIRF